MHNKIAEISEDSIRHAALPRWKTTVLASAAALALLGISVDAQALALGAVTVRSALGEPLRADIEVPQISSEEAATFQAAIASQQDFQAAGVEFSPALTGAKLTLQRRPNGQAYLRLISDRPINEPFMGVVIEANWANGRIVRDYTMLVDPPKRSEPASVTVTESQVTSSNRPSRTTPRAQQVTPDSEATSSNRKASRARASRRAPAPDTPSPISGGGGQVTVQRGDTAYGIVSAQRVDGVSLDQMLIALLRANPKAFINGNVNLVRAGAVLNMPTAEQASAVSRRAARRAVVAQSRSFNAYRRGLAQNARVTASTSSSRSASGSVQPQVDDRAAPPPKQDRLTIAPSGSASSVESTAAQSRQAKEQTDRVAELDRTRQELDALQKAASAPGLNVPVSTPSATSDLPASAPTPVSESVASAPDQAASASVPALVASAASDVIAAPALTESASAASIAASEAAAPVASAPVATPVVKPKPRPAPPPPPEEPSFLESLAGNPLVLAGGALAALLALFGVYRTRQRKKQTTSSLDSSFIESRLQPDSFFGASGGQRVNTRETANSGSSSMAYSPSQLDAAGDVDPVAEADVYLAYGRDMQAEEILKEALRTHTGRVGVHRKLAEIYAKRRDARALESIATEAYELTRGDGPDWQAISTLGVEIDPDNPLYKPGGAPVLKTAPASARHTFGADTEPQTAQLLDKTRVNTAISPESMLDLENAPVRSPAAGHSTSAAAAAVAAATTTGPVDMDLGTTASPGTQAEQGMEFAPPSELMPEKPAAEPAPPVHNSGMIEFDLGDLSADSNSPANEGPLTEQANIDDDPIATKLALAKEFYAIGDADGARTLVKEVIAESSGDIKARAERFLAELS
ncbi:FimV/HubP family polar landmark protein [Ottowia sp.]|uniref:FimV/HubP family polar landmark protein n=1 Tax=Ottowia sp. TaxID=1898956 RepID=UPI003A8BF30F